MNLTNFLPSIRQEVSVLTQLRKSLPPDIFDAKMKDDLSAYFKNENTLEIIIENRTHLWEYSLILEMASYSWFIDSLSFFIEEFNNIKKKNENDVRKSIIKYYPLIQQAMEGYSAAFQLSTLHQEKPINLFARTLFRELGDILETSILPGLRQFHSIFSIKYRLLFSHDSDKANFGNIIEDLYKISEIKFLYRDFLFKVPLNQWRNIAYYSNYTCLDDENKIICKYGRNKVKEVTINKENAEKFIRSIDKVFCLHKIAITFFCSDNSEWLIDLLPKVNISKDTIYASILAVLEVEGIKVLSMACEKDKIELEIELPSSPLKSRLDDILKHAGKFAFISHLGSISFKIYSSTGVLLNEGFLIKSN